jgi:hypothetical protein
MNLPALFSALHSAITLGLAAAILFAATVGLICLLAWLRVSR